MIEVAQKCEVDRPHDDNVAGNRGAHGGRSRKRPTDEFGATTGTSIAAAASRLVRIVKKLKKCTLGAPPGPCVTSQYCTATATSPIPPAIDR